MSRYISWAVLFLSCLPASAVAQDVKVIPQPGAGCWKVSYTRLTDSGDARTGVEDSGYFKTLAAAQQKAASLQRWSRAMAANSSWRLRTIYIEGEDAPGDPPPDVAPETPDLAHRVITAAETALEAKGVSDEARWLELLFTDPDEAMRQKGQEIEEKYRPGSVLQEFTDNVKDTFARVKAFKDRMLKLDQDLMERSFKEVNDAIARYNRELDAGAGLIGPRSASLLKMKPVGPETVKAVGDWKVALKRQFELEQRKEELDRQKVELDRTRDELEREWKSLQDAIRPFDPTNPRVVRLRDQLEKYTADAERYKASLGAYTTAVNNLAAAISGLRSGAGGDSPDGPYRLYLGQFSNTADLSGGGSGEEVRSLAEARSKGRAHMSENAGKQPSYRIEDGNRKVIEARGLFKNVKAPSP